MKEIVWDYQKNIWLKQNRDISFEEVLLLLTEGCLVDILDNPNKVKYGDQKILLVNKDYYIYCVPYIETIHAIRFITIFPSRKYTKIYLEGVRETMEFYEEHEKELIESVESGEWQPVKNFRSLKEKIELHASAELRKRARINIRISDRDLEAIKLKAVEEGVPYQTLITSILHKYITGKIKPLD